MIQGIDLDWKHGWLNWLVKELRVCNTKYFVNQEAAENFFSPIFFFFVSLPNLVRTQIQLYFVLCRFTNTKSEFREVNKRTKVKECCCKPAERDVMENII